MWLEFEYKPTSLFSLKSSKATNSAAKSLLCPSPYSIKMALLNAAITYGGTKKVIDYFEKIRDLKLQFFLPKKIIVNNCLIKIQKIKRNDQLKRKKEEELKKLGFADDEIKNALQEIDANDPFQSTIAFREYIFFSGIIKIAIKIDSLDKYFVDLLIKWFAHINYFGKKGCFFQLTGFKNKDSLNEKFYSKRFTAQLAPGILIIMDDMDSSLNFHNVNSYSNSETKRIEKTYHLPFKQSKASKNFSFYERIEDL